MIGLTITVKSQNKLDTVYLKDLEAWDFYTSYKTLIVYGYKDNYNVLKNNDPKYKDAINLIDKVLKNNTNSESIRKPLLNIGIKPEFLSRYKLVFNQLMAGLFPPNNLEEDYKYRIPDKVMYVIDRNTNTFKYIKCTDFEEFPVQPNIDLQIIDKDVLALVSLNMDKFRKNGYKGK